MTNALLGVLHGTTITLDQPLPPLDGCRVRVVVEPIETGDELSAGENAELLREWSASGPQGPMDDDDDFPGAT